jgi:guanylate kinase
MTQRILQRQTISDDELHKRIMSATFEKEQAKERCDYIIDATQPLEAVCAEIKHIIETTCF